MNPPAAHHGVAVIKHRQLAGGGGSDGGVGLHQHTVPHGGNGAGGLGPGVAEPGGDRPGAVQSGDGDPVGMAAEDAGPHQVGAVGEGDGIGLGVDAGHIVPVGAGDPQPPALAQSVAVDAPVPAQHLAVGGDEVPVGGGRPPADQPGGLVVVGDETDLHGVGLVGHGDAEGFRFGPNGILIVIPKGENYFL